MIAGDAETVGCGARRCIGIAIGDKIYRSGQGGFQQSDIAHTGCTAMFGKLGLVNRPDKRFLDPNEIHFASSRKTLRRFFMMSSASIICCAKSGS
jgi:hypothetical protein